MKKAKAKKQRSYRNAKVSTDLKSLVAAFTEWDRRYREEPERFVSEAVHLLKGNAETYGEEAAPYLVAILNGKL
jgi:hypothetical protein